MDCTGEDGLTNAGDGREGPSKIVNVNDPLGIRCLTGEVTERRQVEILAVDIASNAEVANESKGESLRLRSRRCQDMFDDGLPKLSA